MLYKQTILIKYLKVMERKKQMLIIKFMIKHIFEVESWHNFNDTIKTVYT